MEESGDPLSPNTRFSRASPSLESETPQLSSGNLGLNNGEFEIDGSGPSVDGAGDSVASSSPDHSGFISNGEGNLDFSEMGSSGSSFNLLNPNDFAENLTEKSSESGFGFEDSSISNNVSRFNGFSKGNPDPEAVSNGGNVLGSGFNINGDGDGIINLAMTQAGSKYVQDLLSLKDPRISKLIFDGVIEFIFKLLTNKYGGNLFQKLIEESEGDENRLQMIIEKLTVPENYVYLASIDKYGTFSIKKLITVLKKSPLIVEIVRALSVEFRKLMIHPIGPYVIMECLEVLDSTSNDLLYVEAINNCVRLAMHKRGFLALNALIVRIEGPRRDQLLNSISDQVAFLAQDPTGSSVLECVIALRNPAINAKIFCNLEGYYVRLSMLKTGCLIVLQCLTSSSGMEHVIHEFLRSNELIVAAKDRNGNKVVQAALEETKKRDSKLHESLILKLQQHLDSLQDGYGINVLTLVNSFSSVQ